MNTNRLLLSLLLCEAGDEIQPSTPPIAAPAVEIHPHEDQQQAAKRDGTPTLATTFVETRLLHVARRREKKQVPRGDFQIATMTMDATPPSVAAALRRMHEPCPLPLSAAVADFGVGLLHDASSGASPFPPSRSSR